MTSRAFAPVILMAFGTGVSSVISFFHRHHPSALPWFCVSSPHLVRTNEPERQTPSSVPICFSCALEDATVDPRGPTQVPGNDAAYINVSSLMWNKEKTICRAVPLFGGVVMSADILEHVGGAVVSKLKLNPNCFCIGVSSSTQSVCFPEMAT